MGTSKLFKDTGRAPENQDRDRHRDRTRRSSRESAQAAHARIGAQLVAQSFQTDLGCVRRARQLAAPIRTLT